MRSKVKWIWLGVVVLFAGTLYVLTREPEPPLSVLKKYPIVRSSVTAFGERFVVLKGSYKQVEHDLTMELRGAVMFDTITTSEPLKRGGQSLRYSMFDSTKWGSVTLSDEISEPDPVRQDGYVIFERKNVAREGFCSVSYTPEPSLFGRFLTWVKGIFGDKKPEQSVTFNEMVAGKRPASVKP